MFEPLLLSIPKILRFPRRNIRESHLEMLFSTFTLKLWHHNLLFQPIRLVDNNQHTTQLYLLYFMAAVYIANDYYYCESQSYFEKSSRS